MSYFLVASSSIADCQLPIADFVFAERHINSLQAEKGC